MEEKGLERRDFMRTTVTGAAAMAVGGALGSEHAHASDITWGKRLNEPLVNLLDAKYADMLVGDARKILKKDLIHMRMIEVRDSEGLTNPRIKALNVTEIRSIEDALDQWHKDILQGTAQVDLASLNGDACCCCTCTPCCSCTCAAAVTDSVR
ncbi:MAG: twin-arginine translocation signal domain-containing protein [Acidobacteriota bacterium]